MQHLFKADTNMTAAQYLKFLRLQMARQLIESTFLSTKEIMQRVGIRDESHFVRDFRKTYGLPPASYKRGLPTLRMGLIANQSKVGATANSYFTRADTAERITSESESRANH
jgi:AraC-like DNA-binding protein